MATCQQTNSTVSPIPMQPPIPTTSNIHPSSNLAPNSNTNTNPLPNLNNTASNLNHPSISSLSTTNLNENPNLIPKHTLPITNPMVPPSTISSNPSTLSNTQPPSTHTNTTNTTQTTPITSQTTYNHPPSTENGHHYTNTAPNPNDKDSRRLKHRNSRNISTPSHKLLALHHKTYEELTESDIRKYLNDVPSELLMDCLIDSCIADVSVFHAFDEYALKDPTKVRIFIRGLNYDTTKETLGKAFQRFGTVIDSTVIYDKSNNRSKGYGFITFTTSVEAATACRHGQLEVDNRRTQISLATPLRNKTFGDRDNRRNGDDRDHRDYRHRNNRNRSRSRSRSRDRDNRRHRNNDKGNKRRSDRNNNRNRNDRRNRGGYRGNNRNKRGYMGGLGRGYMGHNNGVAHSGTSAVAHPPHPHAVAGITPYAPFSYGYDTAAYAAAYNPASYNPAAAAAGSAGGNAVQPPYNGNLYAQQYSNYNPYFAGK